MTEKTTEREIRSPATFRTGVQRITGLLLLLIGLGGLWFWWQHPLPGGAPMRWAALAGQAFCLPVGLWQIFYCPRWRDPRPGELPVYNAGWIVPVGAVLELTGGGLLLLLPFLVKSAADLVGFSVCMALVAVVLLASAVVVMAGRNEGLLVAPDGRAECWTVWGRSHQVEERPVQLRIRPRLGRYDLYGAAGRRLYHFDRGMVNEVALLDRLQSLGVANTGETIRQRMADPYPQVKEVLEADEETLTPAHRWLPGMRAVAWLPFAALLAQWWLLVAGLPLLGVRAGSLLACWLPLVFFGAYLVWPQIFVWERYPTKPSARYRGQVLATPAWRRAHVGLGATLLPVVAALLWALAESRAFLVGNPERLAVLCVVLGGLLALACEIRRPRSMTRERGMILLLSALLAFPLGFSLNLALTAPAYPDHGTVVEVRPPEEEGDYATLTFRWEGRDYDATWYGDSSDLPGPAEEVNLCIRESPLGIHAVSVNC